MKKFTVLLSAVLFSVSSAMAQTTREEMYQDLGRCGGVYYVYQNPTKAQTPAPKGYKPFYISHYGRHGSRFLYGDKDYTDLRDPLRKAEKLGCLTALGKSLLARVDTIVEIAMGHGEALSPLGVRQHHDIAQRMYRSFPEVFKAGGHISARSTTVMRCAMSMAAFCEGLKELQPKLDIYREADQKYMSYMNYHCPEQEQFNSSNGPWKDGLRRFEDSHIHPQRLLQSLFSDSTFIMENINPTNFMWRVYWVCSDAQDIDTPVRIYDVFTKEELFDMWQCFNYSFYVGNAFSSLNHGLAEKSVQPLIRNIVETADDVISGKNHDVATLRFGHDGNIVPLAAGLHLDGCDAESADGENFYKVWNDWRVAPMAANIQIIFFKKAPGGNKKSQEVADADILVKFMLNEEEKSLPIKPVTGPYYRWSDVKAFLLKGK